METYDFFIAGRWRNKEVIADVVAKIRAAGFTAFCFLENDYTDIIKKLGLGDDAMQSANTETLPLDHPLIKEVFEKDLKGQTASENFVLVLPAGIAGHVELGMSYGMGKKCYAIGEPEKTESVYCTFEKIFPDVEALLAYKQAEAAKPQS